jgi:hypothetical protein
MKKEMKKKIRFLFLSDKKINYIWMIEKKKKKLFIDEMTKNEESASRAVRRVDLSLPVVQTDSYEIFYNTPLSQNPRLTSRQKPLVEMNKKSNNNQSTRIRSPARLKHLIGPVFVNLVVDMAAMTTESSSNIGDAMSMPINNSNYSNRILKGVPVMTKRNKQKNTKDDGDRSQSSSGNRFRYESLGSFEDYGMNKTNNNNVWQNLHHPQLTISKALHMRKAPKQALISSHIPPKVSNTIPFDNLSQGSAASFNEQLYERIEQLTKNYFPSIQQIRHTRPIPELISNRMHLHREQKRNFMPILSRTRIVR